MNNPKNHPLWSKFVAWATEYANDPRTNHVDDWLSDWECFLSGAVAYMEYDKEQREESAKKAAHF